MTILFCPLNWGLGHATRCVPLLHYYASKGFKVIIAANGTAYRYFRSDFPEFELIYLRGFNLKYPNQGTLPLKWIFGMLPGFGFSILREHAALKRIVNKHKIDVVISDNRYGAWNKKTHNVILTHQLEIISPVRNALANAFLLWTTRKLLSRFDQCWIPDYEGENNLSGFLSHVAKTPETTKFIGPLSRFSLPGEDLPFESYDLLFILSGPEPQRTLFENLILRQVWNSNWKTLIVRGLPGNTDNKLPPSHITMLAHLDTDHLRAAIRNSALLVCRSGYSSVMDLITLQKKAVLVPTPGQTEQEYLAEKLHHEGVFYSQSQNSFSIDDAMKYAIDFPLLDFPETMGLCYDMEFRRA